MMTGLRQICLDTETTGLRPDKGDRVIEIGAVEIIDRQMTDQTFHCFCNPEKESIDAKAVAIHGLTVEFLSDKPLFKDCLEEFLEFIAGAELIMHNAPFDVGFLDAELKRVKSVKKRPLSNFCVKITDTLTLAQSMRPGQGNSLDDLRKHYKIPDAREKHGALIDSRILAKVYLMMTGGQDLLSLGSSPHAQSRASIDLAKYKVIRRTASTDEIRVHEQLLSKIKNKQSLVAADFD